MRRPVIYNCQLIEPADQGEAPPKPQVFDAFCAAFNAGDLDRLTRVRNYFYTPDVLAEICAELQVPFRSNGYRYWKEA